MSTRTAIIWKEVNGRHNCRRPAAPKVADNISAYLRVIPPDVIHHLQDVELPLVAVRQRLQDLVEPGKAKRQVDTSASVVERLVDTYFPRALNEWLKDLEATLSKVWRNTSTFNGLKVSPSSEGDKHRETEGVC